MANYGYILKIRPPLDELKFFEHVEFAVLDVLGPRWKVSWADFEDGGPTLLVTVPGTASVTSAYWGQPFSEDAGFTVSLQQRGPPSSSRVGDFFEAIVHIFWPSSTLAFRHGPSSRFERWAQGCIEEELSETLKASLYYDAGPVTYQPGRHEYRRPRKLLAYRYAMGMPPMKQHYYETTGSEPSYGWKVYHYDESGRNEIIDGEEKDKYTHPSRALDAAVAWCEEHGIDAEMM